MKSPRRKKHRLQAEQLEDRRVLTTFTVTNLLDSGSGSLREALDLANTSAGHDTVEFAPELAGTINLTSGQLEITDEMVLDGSAGQIAIDAGGSSRVLNIDVLGSFAPVSINDITLQNGNADLGGGIRTNEPVELSNVVVRDNTAQSGGGIWAGRELTVNESRIESNVSTSGGGAIHTNSMTLAITISDSTIFNNFSGQGAIRGGTIVVENSFLDANRGREAGAIFATNFLQVTDSDVTANTASTGAPIVAERTTEIINSTVANNQGSTSGGLWSRLDSRFTPPIVEVTGSTFEGNRATSTGFDSRGGAIRADNSSLTISESTFVANDAVSGGGVFFFSELAGTDSDTRDLAIDNSEFISNTASTGGGMLIAGDVNMVMTDSTVAGNQASVSGGGIRFNVALSTLLDRVTIQDNTANDGGGIAIDSRIEPLGGFDRMVHHEFRNSTLSNNTANREGGGLAVFSNLGFGPDGIVYEVDIVSSTIVENNAATGGGIYSTLGNGGNVGPADRFSMTNSIVAKNSATNSPDLSTSDSANIPNFQQYSSSYSIIGTNDGSFLQEGTDAEFNIIGGPVGGIVDPGLGPLADNGGPTMTHLPMSGPAIDSGDPAIGDLFDQRGFDRIVNGTIDRGAVERASVIMTGDFDGDGDLDCDDIGALSAESAGGTNDLTFDVNGDGLVDVLDVEFWVTSLKGTLLGDANLDMSVDASDFNVWNENKFTSATGWCEGNFNGDGAVDASDFNVWNENKFQSASDQVASRPKFEHLREVEASPIQWSPAIHDGAPNRTSETTVAVIDRVFATEEISNGSNGEREKFDDALETAWLPSEKMRVGL